jgi:hypothetical protein
MKGAAISKCSALSFQQIAGEATGHPGIHTWRSIHKREIPPQVSMETRGTSERTDVLPLWPQGGAHERSGSLHGPFGSGYSAVSYVVGGTECVTRSTLAPGSKQRFSLGENR